MRNPKLSAALKAKWASGTRKQNPDITYDKSSLTMKRVYAAGKLHRLTREDSDKGIRARKHENILRAILATTRAKIGVPNPPGRSAASSENWASAYWVLQAPSGAAIEGRNLCQLIRDHIHLFAPEDVKWSGVVGGSCVASDKIRKLLKPAWQWKGWRVLHKEAGEKR